MKREDITHLAELSRIALSETELESLETDLTAIVSYVGVVTDIAADDAHNAPVAGARNNVLRDDVVTTEPEQYTDALLREMPDTKGRHMKVPKILKSK